MTKHESPRDTRNTFANRPAGRIRRDTRRAVLAAKRAWLDMGV